MPIYLAPTSASTTQAHPVFKAKGITTNTAGPLKDLYTTGLATDNQVAYAAYVANISCFVAATNRAMKLSTTSFGMKLSNLARPLLPIPIPKVAYISSFRLDEAAQTQYMVKTAPFLPTSTKTGNQTKITYSKMTQNFATYLAQSCIEFVGTERDEIMPLDVPHYCHLLRVASEFLATNTYPAFTTPLGQVQQTRDYISKGQEWKGYARYESPAWKALRSRVEKEMGNAMTDDGTAPESTAWPDFDFPSFQSSTLFLDTDTVVTAKPSPLPLSYNFGPIAEVPGGLSGNLFPYFYGMNTPDKVTLRKLFLKHFFRTLGTDIKECKASWVTMRASLDRIANTPSGMVLAHLFYGIDLALQTQTRMFVVIEHDGYLGFALFGERYILYDGTEFFEPEASAKLADQVTALSSHLAAVRELCTMMSRLRLREAGATGGTEPVEVKEGEVPSSGHLVREIRKRKFGKEDKEAFAEITRHLKYHEDYFPNTQERILWLLEQITARLDEELALDVPQYIPSNVDLLDEKLFRALCAFGPDAPSFMNTNGRDHFALPRLVADNAGNFGFPQTASLPPKLHVAMKGVATAMNDWKKVIKDRVIRMDFKERAGKNRCMVVSRKGTVDDIFYGLCVLAFQGVGSRGEKRKVAGDMDVDGGAGPKKKRFEDAADMMSALDNMDAFM